VYDRVARRDELLLEFLRARIVSGDRVVYVAEGADARTVSELTALADGGQLEVMSPTDTYLDDAEFDADRVLESIRATRDESLAERCSALRIGGGPPSALTRNGQAHLLSRYERRANELFEQARSRRSARTTHATDPGSLSAIVEAHSIVLYALGPNPAGAGDAPVPAELRRRPGLWSGGTSLLPQPVLGPGRRALTERERGSTAARSSAGSIPSTSPGVSLDPAPRLRYG
jgi:MEDS: MEthanogen/methylotroph, DcmR Sensory domain